VKENKSNLLIIIIVQGYLLYSIFIFKNKNENNQPIQKYKDREKCGGGRGPGFG